MFFMTNMSLQAKNWSKPWFWLFWGLVWFGSVTIKVPGLTKWFLIPNMSLGWNWSKPLIGEGMKNSKALSYKGKPIGVLVQFTFKVIKNQGNFSFPSNNVADWNDNFCPKNLVPLKNFKSGPINTGLANQIFFLFKSDFSIFFKICCIYTENWKILNRKENQMIILLIFLPLFSIM